MDDSLQTEKALALVNAHKEEAKLYRDDNDFSGAVDELKAAIDLLEKYGLRESIDRELSSSQRKIASSLADCHGMRGGNLRRLNRLRDALEEFERGREYEEDPRYGVDSSYNLVNAITLPIEMGVKTATEQKSSLVGAANTLERQTSQGARRQDRWAWADYGQCLLLSGELHKALQAYEKFRALGNIDAVQSHVAVLTRLRDALILRDRLVAATVDQGIKELIKQA